jgi:hypothetical protein
MRESRSTAGRVISCRVQGRQMKTRLNAVRAARSNRRLKIFSRHQSHCRTPWRVCQKALSWMTAKSQILWVGCWEIGLHRNSTSLRNLFQRLTSRFFRDIETENAEGPRRSSRCLPICSRQGSVVHIEFGVVCGQTPPLLKHSSAGNVFGFCCIWHLGE